MCNQLKMLIDHSEKSSNNSFQCNNFTYSARGTFIYVLTDYLRALLKRAIKYKLHSPAMRKNELGLSFVGLILHCKWKWLCMFIVWYPLEFSRLHNLQPWYWNSLLCRLTSTFSAANAIRNSPFFVPPGTHHYWVDRGGMIWEACPEPQHSLKHDSSTGHPSILIVIHSYT